jgi:ABC-type uncharacterized transport system permease subunit
MTWDLTLSNNSFLDFRSTCPPLLSLEPYNIRQIVVGHIVLDGGD